MTVAGGLTRAAEVLERSLTEDCAATAAQLCVILDGETVLDAAVGRAEPASDATRDTVFKVYCAIKPVTAIAVANLADEGALALDEPLRAALPEIRALVEHDITARHLLDHTAGLHEVSGVHMELLPEGERREFVDFARPPQGWRIGVDTGYSEFAAWHLLGRLIEATTGKPLQKHLRASVLDPLGLHSTWIGMTRSEYEACYPRLGLNYDMGGDRPLPLLLERSERVCCEVNCAYGGYTNARDLASFYAAMLEGRAGRDVPGLPSTTTLSELCTSARGRTYDVVLERRCEHGLGFMTSLADHEFGTLCSGDSFGHSGWLGASFGFADPVHRLAVGLILNGVAVGVNAFGRRCALVDAVYGDLGLVRSDAITSNDNRTALPRIAR